MITEEHTKEKISFAYAQMLAANVGMLCEKPDLDYGMDGKFLSVTYDRKNNRRSVNGFCIDFQLKATTNIIEKNGKIQYDLEVKNYRDLINPDVGMPRILIVYYMPKMRRDWLKIGSDDIVLKKCGWWCSLKGLPDTTNKKTVRIEIPAENLLTCEELDRLMECVKKGVEL